MKLILALTLTRALQLLNVIEIQQDFFPASPSGQSVNGHVCTFLVHNEEIR